MTPATRWLSRSDVHNLIAQGNAVVILDGYALKLDSWLAYHPGGDKAILHMIGRDASDEVTAFHSASTRQRMAAFRIGRVDEPWKNLLPPLQGGIYEAAELLRTNTSEFTSTEVPLLVNSELCSEKAEISINVKPTEGHAVRQRSCTPEEHLEPSEKQLTAFDAITQRQLDHDRSRYPQLDTATQQDIIRRYRELDQQIRDQGLYNCDYTAYAREVARYALLFASCLFFLHIGWYGTSGAFLGCFWHQLVFTAHDAGHIGITHDYQTDTIIGIIIADFLGGLSIGWWKRNHNVHHIVTNLPEHDPDIEHVPIFAISHRFFESLFSTFYDRSLTFDTVAQTLVRYQKYLYYPIMAFGRFNLYVLSWTYLALGQGPRKGPAAWHRWLEIAGQIFFWLWFGYGMLYRSIPTASGRLAFLLVSHVVTAPLHVQITLSHFAMSTADLGIDESFPQRMLRTTMDVECPEWLDFFHGGLQFQAIHHLYPRLPRHSLRKAQSMVQDFCREVGIPYALYGFAQGNREVLSRLSEVAKQAAILAECQKTASAHLLGHSFTDTTTKS